MGKGQNRKYGRMVWLMLLITAIISGGIVPNAHEVSEAATVIQTEPEAPEYIRGIPKFYIDVKRGKRGNASQEGEWNAETVQADYARVAIEIPLEEAEQIRKAMNEYTVWENYDKMRTAANANTAGEELDEEARYWLEQYQRVVEYIRVAPSYPAKLEVYRGLRGENPYMDWIRSLKAGDDFDLGRLSSFSTSKEAAKGYATDEGVVLVVENGVVDGIAIDGFSTKFDEHEVLVSDRYFAVISVTFEVPPDKGRVITLRKRRSVGGN